MLTSALSENLPKMAIDRIGIIPEMECPDLDLPEMEREDFPEMGCTGVKE